MKRERPISEVRAGPARRLAASPIVIGVLLLGIVLLATSALTTTTFWTDVFAHEARTSRHGGVAATTIAGARWWRVALAMGGVVLPLLVGAIAWLDRDRRGEAARPEHPRQASAGTGLLLILLLVAGFALRSTRIAESLWYDEIADFLAFGQFGPGPTMGNYFTQSNHVLSGILCWGAVQVAGGANEIILRVPALMASLASIIAFWWLGREVARDVSSGSDGRVAGRVGATALLPWLLAGFAALAPVMVLEAVEARGYAFMILSSALGGALFLRGTSESAAREHDASGTWCLYAVVIALGTWAHLVTACVAAGHAVVLLFDLGQPARRRAAISGLLAIAAAAVLVLMLYSPALPDLLAIRDQFRALDGNEPTLLGPEGLHAILQLGGAWTWWGALPGLGLVFLGLAVGIQGSAARRAIGACLLGGVVAALLAWLGNSWLYARFVLFTLPGAALLVGLGTAWLFARPRGVVMGTSAIVVLLAAWMGDLWMRPSKQPLREAVLEVARARTPDEGVATIGLLDNVLEWYAVPEGLKISPTGVLGGQLSTVLDREQPEWVIVLYRNSVPPERLSELAHRGYVLHTTHRGWVDWGNGDVEVWRRVER